MIAAICLFLVGACAGAYLAIRHFMRRRLPGWVAIAHGAVGATGFGVLLLVCVRNPGWASARVGLFILVGAIALGCVNVVYHLRRLRHRTAIIVAHALSAVAGVGTLTYGVLVSAAPEPAASVAGPAQAAEIGAATASAVPEAHPTAAPAAPIATAKALHPAGFRWSQRTMTFADNSAAPSADSMTDIRRIADEINGDRDIGRVEVQGYADERGSDDLNLALTRARANAVVDALVALGVDRSRLESRGFGARCPVQSACRQPDAPKSCHDESSWRDDRRVELLVTESRGERARASTGCQPPSASDDGDGSRAAISPAGSH